MRFSFETHPHHTAVAFSGFFLRRERDLLLRQRCTNIAGNDDIHHIEKIDWMALKSGCINIAES